VPEENLWTSWCKGRFTEANTPTIRLGATPFGPSSAHLHHPPMILGTKMNFFLNGKADGKRKAGYNRVKLSERSIRQHDCRREKGLKIHGRSTWKNL